jgi:ABC-2 type transport system ATP-binding protein
MKNTLKVDHLELRRSPVFCLHIERLRVHSGDILCIAGPNGSGKTTLIECLAGLIAAPDADIYVHGQLLSANLQATKSLIGYIPDDEAWFIKELCAEEYFDLLISVYVDVGVSREKMQYRVKKLAQLLGFIDFKQQLESLSHGNKKKVQIIAGLLHQPKLVIIDELRNGLDPLAVIAAEQIIRAEAESGACIIAATHDLWWAERMAKHTLLLTDGRVAIYEQTAVLLDTYGSLEKLFIQLSAKRSSSYESI